MTHIISAETFKLGGAAFPLAPSIGELLVELMLLTVARVIRHVSVGCHHLSHFSSDHVLFIFSMAVIPADEQ